MPPLAIAPVPAALGRRWLRWIAIQPTLDIEVIVLLAPQHAGEGLTLNAPHVFVGDTFLQGGVEGIRLGNATSEHGVEVIEVGRPFLIGGEPDANRGTAMAWGLPSVKSGNLGAFSGRVDRFSPLVNDIFVEGVLEIACPSIAAVEARNIGLVIAK